jgi:hypothetical protein
MNKLDQAKARIRAKKFAQSIPMGLAIKMPDEELEFLDSQDDDYVQTYMNQLKQLAKPANHYKLGILWERL